MAKKQKVPAPDYDYEEDEKSPVTLKQISNLAAKQLKLEDEIAVLELSLKEKNASLKEISEQTLPELMEAENLPELVYGDVSIKVSDVWYASINDGNRPTVIKFLKKHALETLMTNDVTIKFMKGQEKWLKQFLVQCARRKKSLNMSHKEAINTGTFKATVKKMVEDGEEVNLKELGVNKIHRAVTKRTKEK